MGLWIARNLTANYMKRLVIFGLAAIAAGPAMGQQPKSLGVFNGWTAIEATEPGGKVCYMVGRPEASEPANVRRGIILLTVTHRPAGKARDEVSFQAGYPLKPATPVVLAVERKAVELAPRPDANPEMAWAKDPAGDKTAVEALRAGKTVVVKGVSQRGTATADTFALAGFARAYAEIGKACGVK